MRTTLPPQLSVDTFCAMADGLTDIIRTLRGSAESGFGAGYGLAVPIEEDFGYSKAMRQYEALAMSIPHYPTASRLTPHAHFKTVRGGDQMVLDHVHELLLDLSNVCAATPLPTSTKRRHQNIAEYATYFNSGPGGPYKALVSREVADIYELLYRGRAFGAANIYAPVMVLARRTVGQSAVVVAEIDRERFAGAPLRARVEGFQGAPGQVTAVGFARMSHGGPSADIRTWAATVDGDGDFDLTADVDGDLCLSVQSIGLPAMMSGGTITIESVLPARLR